MNPQTLLAWVAGLFVAATLFSHTVAGRLTLLGAGIVLPSICLARSRELRPLPPFWIGFALWVRNMTDSLLVRQNSLLFWAITGALLGLAARPWRA